jgi:glutathione peroxidase-family protein
MRWFLLPLLAAASPAFAESPAISPTEAPMKALALTQLDGTPLAKGALEGKAVLFVNVASKCGFTRQYDGLQALYAAQKDSGLVVVGVPCNQFGAQEPGKPEEIASFCKLTYGVEFPMLEKQDVNGAGRSDLYKWLVGSEAGGGKDIGWNFEKFLVDRNGNVVGRYPSKVEPSDAALKADIAKALAR